MRVVQVRGQDCPDGRDSACATAELTALDQGVSVAKAAVTILGDILAAAEGGAVGAEAAVATDIVTYGEPVVACVMRDIAGTGSGSATKLSAQLTAAEIAAQVIADHGWTYQ